MASIFKRKGKDKDGKTFESRFWWASWTDARGRRRSKSMKTSDKETAKRNANEYEKRESMKRAGIIDAASERFSAQARRPLVDHLADFRKDLDNRGNTAQHNRETESMVRKTIVKCKAEFICDLQASNVQQAMKSILDKGASPRTAEKGVSPRTANAYLQAIKSFSTWLFEDHRTPHDVLIGLSGYNEEADRRHVRREIPGEEFLWLIQTTYEHTTVFHRCPGPDRAMAYILAAATGFRSGELRSLTPESFDLDGDYPTATVKANYSKHRREDVQPLPLAIIDRLRNWLDGREAGKPVFSELQKNSARMVRSDLRTARAAWIEAAKGDKQEQERREKSDFLKYTTDAGVFDFHAHRHLFVSCVVNNSRGSVKSMQTLARHSDPKLTIGRYAHPRLHDMQGALAGLPMPTTLVDDPDRQEMRATGTDGIASASDIVAGEMRNHPLRNPNEPRLSVVVCENDDDADVLPKVSRKQKSPEDSGLVCDGLTGPCDHLRTAEGKGVEPSTPCGATDFESDTHLESAVENKGFSDTSLQSASRMSARDLLPADLPPDLATVVDRWAHLPPAVRAGILAMVETVSPKGDAPM